MVHAGASVLYLSSVHSTTSFKPHCIVHVGLRWARPKNMKLWLLRVSKVNEKFSGVCLFVPRIETAVAHWVNVNSTHKLRGLD